MSNRPNILLITADQMRWDCLGVSGNPIIKTPNLDKIANRGTLFNNGFSPDPICVPGRASIMTGNYPQICTGFKSNNGKIKDGQPLITETLKAVGYKTYALGKLHFSPYSSPDQPRLVHGFEHVELHESGRILAQYDPMGKLRGLEDYFDYLADNGWKGYSRAHGVGNNDVRPCPSPLPEKMHVDHWIAGCTIKQIDKHQKTSSEKPFFMWMSSPKPHSPYDPPKNFTDMYDPREIPKPFGSANLLGEKNPELEKTRYSHCTDTISPEAWQVIRSYYYNCISYLDSQIGRVTAHLKEKGLLENTIILFTADHGDLIGDFGSCFKANHLNGSVRVPFFAAGPGIKQGQVSNALVGLQDILPTFASLAKTKIPKCQGIDLSAHLADSTKPVRDIYYATTENILGQSAMVTDGTWKYIYSEANATEELYNQIDDIAEINNLVKNAEHADILEKYRKILIEKARELKDDKLFEENGSLKSAQVNREKFKEITSTKTLGWRFY